jgi:hypothetical protein
MGCGGCGGCGPGVELPAGLVTELVIADEREAVAVAEAPAPSRRWPGIDAQGVDQVKLASLWALLAGRAPDETLIHAFTPLAEISEEGPWVFRFPAALAAALAALDERRAAAAAAAWARTEALEVEGWEPADVRALLDALRGVARAAAAAGKPLLMWVSL